MWVTENVECRTQVSTRCNENTSEMSGTTNGFSNASYTAQWRCLFLEALQTRLGGRNVPFSDGVPGDLKLLSRCAAFSGPLPEAVDMLAALCFLLSVNVFSR